MADEPRNPAPAQDPPYRVYSSGSAGPRTRSESPRGGQRPYKVYRSGPRGLRARLRGEQDLARPGSGRPGGPRHQTGGAPAWRRHLRPRRLLGYLVAAVVLWVGLSIVLFMVSASHDSTYIPASARAELTPGGNMVTSADTILILGTDQRPRTGPGSKEPGSDYNNAGSNSDTIMLWRLGGGTSRRLSIPRDTATNIPGVGLAKINAAYSAGGATLALKTIEQFTGLQINHIIVINLANFPAFIDDIGGITLKTDRVCSTISGGVKNGGFTLNLSPGVHHLTGEQALILARTRENACNPAENDLTREMRQQQILNAIKSKLLTPTAFLHLPWASYDAPKTLQTDMGGFTLLEMFLAAEIGGSAPTMILKPTGGEVLPNGGDALTATPGDVHNYVDKLMNG